MSYERFNELLKLNGTTVYKVSQRADVVTDAESNIMQSVNGEFCVALRGQRANHA